MIAPLLAANAGLYDVLRAERKIPNVLPELVKERLEKGVCICGASLDEGTTGYAHLTQQLDDEHRSTSLRRLFLHLPRRLEVQLSLQARARRTGSPLVGVQFRRWSG